MSTSRFADPSFYVRLFWVLTVLSIVIWSRVPGYVVGWDVDVYKAAVASLRAGHDPYVDATDRQRAYQLNPKRYDGGDPIPYAYVYSPITLPAVRAIARVPLRITVAVYWALLFFFIAVLIRVELAFAEPGERAVFGLFATVAIFFPAMLYSDAFFSGNIAYILYGLVLAAAALGWRRGVWAPFYVAVLLAGCVKAPMLSLLAIPVFSGRRQWLAAGITGAAGVLLFAMQPRVWPALFAHYMQAVQLQFDFNRDFSSSPAGLITNAFYNPATYKLTAALVYVAYAVPLAITLFVLSRRFLAGRITAQRWLPVLLVGTILLNPRVMEYDIAPLALPVAIITWRFLRKGHGLWATAAWMAGIFAVVNVLASLPHTGLSNPPWKLTAGCVMSLAFIAGAWDLLHGTRSRSAHAADIMTPQPERILA